MSTHSDEIAPARSHCGPVVGPNVVIQVAAAIESSHGARRRDEIFAAAGLSHYATSAPTGMIPEDEARRVLEAVSRKLPRREASLVLGDAGRRTADYIIANRIPKAAQRLLAILPRTLGARALLFAIGKHAWTFAGSGDVRCRYGPSPAITIRANPLVNPDWVWHAAVFMRLFEILVDPETRIRTSASGTGGANDCRFVVELGPRFGLTPAWSARRE